MKKLTLIVLMLGIILMLGSSVSAMECDGDCPPSYESPCADVDICSWTTSESPDYGLPLGSEDTAQCGLDYRTYWPLDTISIATCEFEGDLLDDAMLYVSINNDIVSCTLNGEEVFGSTTHEGCAPVDPRDGFEQDIYSEVIDGTNTLICTVEDRGVMTHFDACVVGDYSEECEVIVDEPVGGEWYDPITIRWHYEGACDPFEYQLAYQEGNCDGDGWMSILSDITPDVGNDNIYEWDVTGMSDGSYCIAANMDQENDNDVTGHSGIWYLDLTPPEVFIDSVSSPKVGDCTDGQTGDCYINQDTLIALTCEDTGSGPDEIWYSINDGDDVQYEGPFSFEQDSEHTIEYWCFDEVLKESTHKSKDFIVDSAGPEFASKVVDEPKVSGCDEVIGGESCEWYLTKDTEICLEYTDPLPHPVNGVEIFCTTYWWFEDTEGDPDNVFRIDLDENGCFKYEQDSYHMLHCWAEDALGNRDESEDLYEADIVDSQAPNSWLYFEGPQYGCDPQYIDGVTTVVIEAEDSTPHPVGLETIEYRVSQPLADKFCNECEGWMDSLRPDMGEWMPYYEPFSMEESCHVIEYRSTDFLGNVEDINWECVFVDKTAPKAVKEIIGTSHDCNGLWEIVAGKCEESWDWIITMDTEIELSCEEQGPHPSGVKELCYRWFLDGKPATDGWDCVPTDSVTVNFDEESEHLLEFYCVDNVEKTSEIDSELFKVQGEEFDIELFPKWNLISIPFNLISNDIDEVFNQISEDVEVVWSYDADGWHVYAPEGPSDLTTIDPGYGYWVKINPELEESILMTVGGSLLSPGHGLPPSVPVHSGWNLLGHYGTHPKQSYCALFSLVDTTQSDPRWSAVYGYDAENDQFVSRDLYQNIRPGHGYWVEMDVEDTYSPATVCWGYPMMP